MSERDIRRYCAVWGRPLPVWKQTGGDRYKVLFNNHPIIVKEDIEGSFIMIHGGEKKGGRPCFILDIDPDGNSTFIDLEAGRTGDTCLGQFRILNDEIEDWADRTNRAIEHLYHEMATTDNYEDSIALVKVALFILKERGARQIELTDNSTIRCPDKINKIDLAELSFITTGQTWYERQIPGLRSEETHIAERLKVWRRTVHEKMWGEVAPWIPEAADQGSSEELAKDVLSRMKKSGIWCKFFANNMDNCRKAFGIETRIHGSHWSAPIARIRSGRKTRKSYK